jgi:hypothetical protein
LDKEVSAELIVREATVEEVCRCLSRWDWVKEIGCEAVRGARLRLQWVPRPIDLGSAGGGVELGWWRKEQRCLIG